MTTTEAIDVTPELAALVKHEEAIEQNLVDIGWHLQAIRDGRKYRAAGYDLFEDYCRDRLGMSKTHVNRQIKAAETIAVIAATTPNGVTPTTEAQVRPLTTLPPEEQADAWNTAVEAAEGKPPTGVEVQAVVDEIKTPKPAPAPEPPPDPEPIAAEVEPEVVDIETAAFDATTDEIAKAADRFRNPPLLHIDGLSFDFAGVRFETRADIDLDPAAVEIEVVRWVYDAIKQRIRTEASADAVQIVTVFKATEPDPPRDEVYAGPVDGDETRLGSPATAPPWKAYPYVSVDKLIAGIGEHGNAAKLRLAITWEQAHENRDAVLNALDRRIAQLEQ